jgi:tetratricopeptide (TPR) repeat protein
MKIKLIAGLFSCLTFAPLTLPAAPGASAAGPNDTDRFQHATSADGKSASTYIERASRKVVAGDYPGALADCNAALRIDPKSEIAHYYRAGIYSALDRPNEAIPDLDVVIRAIPNEFSAYFDRGYAYAELGNANMALADFDNAIRYATNTADGNLAEAHAYYQKGDYAKAAAFFAKARQKSPRDESVLNAVAWFKATCPDGSFRNGKEALTDATKACELTKWQDGEMVDTLAAACAEMGDFKQAVKYQMQALGLRPRRPDSLKGMQRRLRLFQAHQPFREEPKLRKSRT